MNPLFQVRSKFKCSQIQLFEAPTAGTDSRLFTIDYQKWFWTCMGWLKTMYYIAQSTDIYEIHHQFCIFLWWINESIFLMLRIWVMYDFIIHSTCAKTFLNFHGNIFCDPILNSDRLTLSFVQPTINGIYWVPCWFIWNWPS